MLVKANLDEERWRIAQAWGRVERWHILHARGNDRDVARAFAKLNYLCYWPIIREIVLTPRPGGTH